MKPRVAFVVQRYGREVNGGAEVHCRQVAEHMQGDWQVEVLTTCARDYVYRFENDYAPGSETIGGVPVRRFALDYWRSEPEVFSGLDEKVLARQASIEDERRWLKEVGPWSSELIAFVGAHRDDYDLFVFFTYLYATTTMVLPLVREKAVLVPTAHDEPPLRARYFDTFFSVPMRLFVNTDVERRLLESRSRVPISEARVVGVGFDEPVAVDVDLQASYGLSDYFLYVGRVQKEKNCEQLFDHYLALPADVRRQYPLVLAGSAAMEIPDDSSIVALGFVDDETKAALMANARALIMPSIYESLSMVVMESWMSGVPVIVNGASEVLKAHVTASDGGLAYTSRREFHDAVAWLIDAGNAERIRAMCENGRRYVEEHYSWDVITASYRGLIDAGRKGSLRPKVAFVVQRCGRDVNGGAEVHCLQAAEHMARHWDVEILTTAAQDYMTWDNHYPPGAERCGDIVIRRFPVETPRDIDTFNRLSDELHAEAAIASLERQEEWMRQQGPWSPALGDYIASHRDDYRLFFFFTWSYATTWFNLPLVSDKAILLPLAHDEWLLKLNMWDRFIDRPVGFIFNTPEERQLLQTRFPNAKLDGPVAGVGIERPDDIDPLRFRAEFGIDDDFILYVGRIDEAKGCDRLFANFLECRARGVGPGKLVLMGKAVMEIPAHPDILPLGFVEERVKWDALAACQCLVMPSPYESLSIVVLEAWSVGKPVLVNGACDVLVGQCRRANGGLWYDNTDEFVAALERLYTSTCADVLGRQGLSYVRQHYAWHNIEGAYLDVAARVAVGATNVIR